MLIYRHVLLFCLTEAALLPRFRDLRYEVVEFVNETSEAPFNGKSWLKRTGHGNPRIFMEFDLTETLRDYDGELKIYYSRLGNKQFRLSPFKLARQSVCRIFNAAFLKYYIHDMKHCSNLPLSEDPNNLLCDMPLGHYYIRNYAVDLSIIPPILQPGRYRALLFYYKKGKTEVAQIWMQPIENVLYYHNNLHY